MSRLKYVRHCLCNTLYVYCRGRAVTNVGKTCGPTPCFVLAIKIRLSKFFLLREVPILKRDCKESLVSIIRARVG